MLATNKTSSSTKQVGPMTKSEFNTMGHGPSSHVEVLHDPIGAEDFKAKSTLSSSSQMVTNVHAFLTMKKREETFLHHLIQKEQQPTKTSVYNRHIFSTQGSEKYEGCRLHSEHQRSKISSDEAKLNKVFVWHVPRAINHPQPTAQAMEPGPFQCHLYIQTL